jgi:hypothetical protein
MLEYWSSGSRCRGGSTGAGWRQPDPDRRWEPGRGVGLEALGQPDQLGVEPRVLDPGQHPGRVLDGVVVVEDAAGVGQQLPQGDPVAEGQQPRQPALDRVIQAEPALFGQLQHQHGRPDLADTLQPHPGIHRHGLAGGHIRDTGRPRPAPVRPGDIGGGAGGDACAAAGQLVEHTLQVGPCHRLCMVAPRVEHGDGDPSGDEHERHDRNDPGGAPADSRRAGVVGPGGGGDGRHSGPPLSSLMLERRRRSTLIVSRGTGREQRRWSRDRRVSRRGPERDRSSGADIPDHATPTMLSILELLRAEPDRAPGNTP